MKLSAEMPINLRAKAYDMLLRFGEDLRKNLFHPPDGRNLAERVMEQTFPEHVRNI